MGKQAIVSIYLSKLKRLFKPTRQESIFLKGKILSDEMGFKHGMAIIRKLGACISMLTIAIHFSCFTYKAFYGNATSKINFVKVNL